LWSEAVFFTPGEGSASSHEGCFNRPDEIHLPKDAAVNLTFVAAARQFGELDGQVIAFFVIAVAAAEVGVGLAIVIDVARRPGTVDVDEATDLRG